MAGTTSTLGGGMPEEEAKEKKEEPRLPPNARGKLRALLQNLTCPGDFAGSIPLPAATPLPIIAFFEYKSSDESAGTSRSPEKHTLRLAVEKGRHQYDALVEASPPPPRV
jgi:hypothetical protein